MRGEVRLDATITAVVGGIGAGLTTLASRAARLYDADEGTDRLDGHDVRSPSLDSGSGTIGLVSQKTYLVHDIPDADVRFAALGDADLDAAVHAARIDRMVETLPQGYDTVVAARGYRFSDAERRRVAIAIAIARRLLRNPRSLIPDQIVVLDGGRVLERGKHDELMSRGGRYARLAGKLIS